MRSRRHRRHLGTLLLLPLVVLLLASAGAEARSEEGRNLRFVGVSELSFPLMDMRHGGYVAVAHAKRVVLDHQRKGFFKVGLLPMVSIRDATVEIRDADRFVAGLHSNCIRLAALSESVPVLIDGLRFTQPENRADLLRARSARIVGGGDWKLTGVTLFIEGRILEFPTGEMKVGPDATEILVASPDPWTGKRRHILFSSTHIHNQIK